MHVFPCTATQTFATTHDRMDDNRVPHLKIRHMGTDGMHPSSILVSDGKRQRRAERFRPYAFYQMQVRPAHPSSANFHDDIRRICNRYIVNLFID